MVPARERSPCGHRQAIFHRQSLRRQQRTTIGNGPPRIEFTTLQLASEVICGILFKAVMLPNAGSTAYREMIDRSAADTRSKAIQ
ncbi:hypothetical protein VTN49DRAFT_3991 [Thermomyces lanuginosus]|uniref:uncharacterized protein n=1 Tax=Thermomyces lanuginosus TaxID=5541 RepID=UPI003742782A